MDYNAILNIVTKVIDIAFVWMLFYFILKYLRNNSKLILIFKGVLVLIFIKILSELLNLNTIGLILEYVLEWAPIAIIVIFQPEIRTVLESIGRSKLLGRHKILTVDQREKVVYEITQAIDYLKKNRIGALITIERDYSLHPYIEPANKIYADISSELLVSIFFPNNPLHDGAVVIQGEKISCAGVILPTSMNPSISKRLGTRHRAALGISEITDAIAIVVSEETGRISIAVKGELNYNLSVDDAKMILMEELQPKKEVFYDADEDTKEGNKDEENII